MAVLVSAALASACGARRITLPTDPGTPLQDFAQIHAGVSDVCRGVRTLRAEIRLAGHAGDEALRGTVDSAFDRAASMRLELRVGPFNTAAFILVANDSGATLLLPRHDRVVRGARAEDILGALTGVTLTPADLQAILTGCVVPAPRPVGGRQHAGGWASIDLEGGTVVFLQQSGDHWRVRAARRPDVDVAYLDWPDSALFPRRVQLRADMPIPVDLRATLAQVETNVPFGDATIFTVNVPAGAQPMTVEELRASGPLRAP